MRFINCLCESEDTLLFFQADWSFSISIHLNNGRVLVLERAANVYLIFVADIVFIMDLGIL